MSTSFAAAAADIARGITDVAHGIELLGITTDEPASNVIADTTDIGRRAALIVSKDPITLPSVSAFDWIP
jgi:hypothetical protein